MAFNIAKLEKSLKATQKALKKELKREEELLQKGVFAVAAGPMSEVIRKATPVDTGALRAALEVEPSTPAPKIALKNGQSYAAAVEFNDPSLAGSDTSGDKKGNRPKGSNANKGQGSGFMQKGFDWAIKNMDKELKAFFDVNK